MPRVAPIGLLSEADFAHFDALNVTKAHAGVRCQKERSQGDA